MKPVGVWSSLLLVASLLVGCVSREEAMFIKIGTSYRQAVYRTDRLGLHPTKVSCSRGLRGIKFDAEMVGQQSDMTIPEARELIVRQTELLISEICGHQEVLAALEGNLFGAIEIAILFPWERAGESSIDNLAAVFIGEGMVHYEGFDPKTFSFYGLHQESYQDAVDRVKYPPAEEILDTPPRKVVLPESKEQETAGLIRASMYTQHRLLKYGLPL